MNYYTGEDERDLKGSYVCGECGRCDRYGFDIDELHFIDSDYWGFCDECWEVIQRTGRVD